MVPEFSSTKGIHIAMVRFSEVTYNSVNQTITVGAGCLWDRVYKKVAEYNRNVIGGSASQGVGVAGWLLGGGYSLKSNKYGLGIDHVTQYRIVLPSGEIMEATEKKNSDLFQALRGGGNNFGIVTQFTIKTHSQGPVYGASLVICPKDAEKAKRAILDFVNRETRREAAIVAAFRHELVPGRPKPVSDISVLCVFDGKKPSHERDVPFQKFREIIKHSWNEDPAGWGTAKKYMSMTSNDDDESDSENEGEDTGFREMSYDTVQNMLRHPYDPMPHLDDDSEDSDGHKFSMALPLSDSLEANYHSNDSPRSGVFRDMANLGELNARGRFGCIMVSKYTKRLIDTIEKEAAEAAKSLRKKNGERVIIDVWPCHPKIFENSPPGAAWPHTKDQPYGPLLAYFRWKKEEDDDFWVREMNKALRSIYHVALSEGCMTMDFPYYSNTSLEDVPVERIYLGNLERLSKVRAKYDPDDVMGMTGGYRIPLPGSDDTKPELSLEMDDAFF